MKMFKLWIVFVTIKWFVHMYMYTVRGRRRGFTCLCPVRKFQCRKECRSSNRAGSTRCRGRLLGQWERGFLVMTSALARAAWRRPRPSRSTECRPWNTNSTYPWAWSRLPRSARRHPPSPSVCNVSTASDNCPAKWSGSTNYVTEKYVKSM